MSLKSWVSCDLNEAGEEWQGLGFLTECLRCTKAWSKYVSCMSPLVTPRHNNPTMWKLSPSHLKSEGRRTERLPYVSQMVTETPLELKSPSSEPAHMTCMCLWAPSWEMSAPLLLTCWTSCPTSLVLYLLTYTTQDFHDIGRAGLWPFFPPGSGGWGVRLIVVVLLA